MSKTNNKKLNIVHVGNIRDQKFNGVCVVVPKHLEGQSKYANVALLNINEYIPSESKEKYPVYTIQRFGTNVSKLPEPHNSPSLVVFHEVYWPVFITISKQLKKRGIPYIIVPHSSLTDVAQYSKKHKKQVANILLFNRFIKGSEAIHYLSEFEKKSSAKWSTSSFVSSNGMALPKEVKSNFNNDDLKLVYVGRLDINQKGLDRLIEVARIIKNKTNDCNITFSISGTDFDNNKSIIQESIRKYELDKIVKLQEAVFGNDKIQLLLKHDCFVQLSRSEGQPMGMLEAMSFGIPTIATEGTSMKEAISKSKLGFAVSDDPVVIAKVILDLSINKNVLKKMSENSRLYISKHHNWDYISKRTTDEYRRCLKV